MDDSGEIVILRFRPEPSEDVTIRIPTKALVVIREIAEERDMSVEALLRYYISFGVREDVVRRWEESQRGENERAG
jgi:uncharacterized membrane protein